MLDVPPQAAKGKHKPDTEDAIRFLEALTPDESPVVICTMPREGGAPAAAVLRFPADRDKCLSGLASRVEDRNFYYVVNEAAPPARWTSTPSGNRPSKPKKEDIVRLRAVVADLDPEGGAADFAAERERLLAEAEMWEIHPTPPSAIIDSGGGVQMVWFLAEPLEATPENVTAVEAQSRGLARLLGGDDVWNADRLLRLPGTLNLPGDRKRAKGRVDAPTRLLHLDKAARYTLADLAAIAPPVAPGAGSGTLMDLGGFDYDAVLDAARAGIDSLPEHLREIVERDRDVIDRLLAANGHDRSAADWALLTRYVEKGVTNPTELGMLCFSLHAERLFDEAKGGEAYARRTIAKALAHTSPDHPLRPEDFFSPVDAGSLAVPSLAPAKRISVITGPIDVSRLPVRQWLLHPRLPLGDVVQCVGEPGVSKSTFALREALLVASGDPKMRAPGERLHRTGPVIVYNAEDRLDEMERRLAALMRHYSHERLPHPIILLSGAESSLRIMQRAGGRPGAPLMRAAGADMLEALIAEHEPGLVILDPQVDLAQGADENSNDDMNALLQALAGIAARRRICILVIHHTSKATRAAKGDMGAGRGAFAAVGKVRSAFTMVRVTGESEEGKAWGLGAGEALIRLDYSKTSHDRRPTEPIVFRVVSAPVGNSAEDAPREAADLFPEDPAEALRLAGDYAPVLELVDHRGLSPAAGRRTEESARATAVAGYALEALRGESEAKLADLIETVGARMREGGWTKAKAPNVIRPEIYTPLLTPGVAVEHAGWPFRIVAEQRGSGPTAPWWIVAQEMTK